VALASTSIREHPGVTSPPKQVLVKCPNCGECYWDWYRASLNLDLDDFDAEYIDSASSAVCPQCGTKVYFDTLIVEDGEYHLNSDETDQ
jgi:predicted RNA-binding Zn-ribbon protein involved in translation (DUF1610 family)